jgi:signal transduction histidine kinase
MGDGSPAAAQTRCAAACGCVTAVVVEDLQGPVAELRGYLEALARSDRRGDARLVEAARDVGDRIHGVVDALTAYADVDRVAESRPSELGPIVAAAAEAVADELSTRGIDLRVAPLPQVIADPRQLYRAMVVLMRLVARASAAGSALTVRALRRDDEWQLRVGIEPPSSDDLSPRDRREGQPTDGVELLTAQRVAESHGGRLWVVASDDAPTVWLALPDWDRTRPPTPRPEACVKGTNDG